MKPSKKVSKKLAARIAAYDSIPSSLRKGYHRPGSQNRNKR